jgi:hypothetical protein
VAATFAKNPADDAFADSVAWPKAGRILQNLPGLRDNI